MRIAAMPILEALDMPESLYRQLAVSAKLAHRSMAQQAMVALQSALAVPSAERRAALFARLQADDRRFDQAKPAPEMLIRADRER